ncbi:AraC family transcriptional regulator [Marinicrinis lubricantis]|uniref:Helix-turn-helix transcriptional regulator n=1 Tax=Marinicrinis lubricantis TaxID=2086470 RepID=A0ABW1IPS0_9BACL
MSEEQIIQIQTPPMPYATLAGKSEYRPGDQHPNRINIGEFDLIIVSEGRLFIGEEKMQWELQPGQTLILLPNAYHYATAPCQENTIFYWMHFQTSGEWEEVSHNALQRGRSTGTESHLRLGGENYAIQLPKQWNLSNPSQVYSDMEQLLMLSIQSKSATFWKLQQTLNRLLQRMDQEQRGHLSTPALKVAESAEAFIRSHYHREVTNTMLSDALHFHEGYIARCMKEVYGCTPLEYLLHYRLEQAKLLLLKTDLPMSAVAEQTGFQQAAYFSRMFSRQFGLSPSQYRKLHAIQ